MESIVIHSPYCAGISAPSFPALPAELIRVFQGLRD